MVQYKKIQGKGMYMKIGCMILAGGKSSRMGQDKALLEYAGKNFIECIVAELEFFEEKIIARGNNRIVQNMKELSWTILPDIYPGHGPIGGLHAALKACESDALVCVSCAMPLITRGLVKKICDEFLEQCSREDRMQRRLSGICHE